MVNYIDHSQNFGHSMRRGRSSVISRATALCGELIAYFREHPGEPLTFSPALRQELTPQVGEWQGKPLEFSAPPANINAMGWITPLGLFALVFTQRELPPLDIVSCTLMRDQPGADLSCAWDYLTCSIPDQLNDDGDLAEPEWLDKFELALAWAFVDSESARAA